MPLHALERELRARAPLDVTTSAAEGRPSLDAAHAAHEHAAMSVPCDDEADRVARVAVRHEQLRSIGWRRISHGAPGRRGQP